VVGVSMNLRPLQEWEEKQNDGNWRPIQIANVLGTQVEYKYLDMPGVSDVGRARAIPSTAMGDPKKYRLTKDAP
jgi:hypothetical protein